MNKIAKTLAITALLTSFTACSTIGDMKPKEEITATKSVTLEANQNPNPAILVNTATEQGFEFKAQSPTQLTFVKDMSGAGAVFGFTHEISITVTLPTAKKKSLDFMAFEESNSDKISYTETKMVLDDFVSQYLKDASTQK